MKLKLNKRQKNFINETIERALNDAKNPNKGPWMAIGELKQCLISIVNGDFIE